MPTNITIRVLTPDESPRPYNQRLFCLSDTTDVRSEYLTSWRDRQYGHQHCRFRAKYEVDGVPLCQRHLNELAGELLLCGQDFTVEVSGLLSLRKSMPDRSHLTDPDKLDWGNDVQEGPPPDLITPDWPVIPIDEAF